MAPSVRPLSSRVDRTTSVQYDMIQLVFTVAFLLIVAPVGLLGRARVVFSHAGFAPLWSPAASAAAAAARSPRTPPPSGDAARDDHRCHPRLGDSPYRRARPGDRQPPQAPLFVELRNVQAQRK